MQTITLTRPLPSGVAPGTASVLAATGGASGNPVTFSVDGTTYPSDACTVNAGGTRVKYASVGTCVLNVDQAGSLRHLAAHRTVSVTIRPPGLASLVVSRPAGHAVVGSLEFTARGLDGSGNDLGDVTPITTFTIGTGACSQGSCFVFAAGPTTVTAAAVGARGRLSLNVALFVALVSNGTGVTSIPATVGARIDAFVGVYGGDSGTYKFAIPTGSLPRGVTLTSDGSFTGRPRHAGTYPFTLVISDTSNSAQRGTVTGDITVSPAP